MLGELVEEEALRFLRVDDRGVVAEEAKGTKIYFPEQKAEQKAEQKRNIFRKHCSREVPCRHEPIAAVVAWPADTEDPFARGVVVFDGRGHRETRELHEGVDGKGLEEFHVDGRRLGKKLKKKKTSHAPRPASDTSWAAAPSRGPCPATSRGFGRARTSSRATQLFACTTSVVDLLLLLLTSSSE